MVVELVPDGWFAGVFVFGFDKDLAAVGVEDAGQAGHRSAARIGRQFPRVGFVRFVNVVVRLVRFGRRKVVVRIAGVIVAVRVIEVVVVLRPDTR